MRSPCSAIYLECNLAHSANGFPSQLLVNVIHVLCQLCGNVIGIGLISYGSEDVQLQMLDVGRLIDAAVESCVDLKHRSAKMRLKPSSVMAAEKSLEHSVSNAKDVDKHPLH